jgi:hypothetical protein
VADLVVSREGKGVVVEQRLQLFLGFQLRNFIFHLIIFILFPIHNAALHAGTTVYIIDL